MGYSTVPAVCSWLAKILHLQFVHEKILERHNKNNGFARNSFQGTEVAAAPIPDQTNTRGLLCEPAGTQIVSPASVVPDCRTG